MQDLLSNLINPYSWNLRFTVVKQGHIKSNSNDINFIVSLTHLLPQAIAL